MICQFQTEELSNGQYRHTCSNCGSSVVSRAAVYTRRCTYQSKAEVVARIQERRAALPPRKPCNCKKKADIACVVCSTCCDDHLMDQDWVVSRYHELLQSDFEPPPLKGSGIVLCGEGRYEPMLVVAAKMCRKHTRLPIQIWSNGDFQLKDKLPEDVRLVNTQKFREDHPSENCTGFGTKSYAVCHSGWQKVLYLDADAYLVEDVEAKLARVESLVYWSTNNYYPPTVASYMPGDFINIECQGGAYAVNMEKCWKHMVLTRWVDDHAEWFWRRGHNRYHDEASHRLALQTLHTPFQRLSYWWAGGCMVMVWDGSSSIVHRIRRSAKMFPDLNPRFVRRCPGEEDSQRWFRELVPVPPRVPKRRERVRRTRK